MIDAHQNLNGSRHLTTPLSGMCRELCPHVVHLSVRLHV